MVDINHTHVPLAHAHSSVLKATSTAHQHGIQLVDELDLCATCSMAKGIRAPSPHHATSRAVAPINMVHIDTMEPYRESLGDSRYVVMFVDSALRLQHMYGTRDKSASPILGGVIHFVANVGAASVQNRQRHRVYHSDVHQLLQRSQNPPRANGPIYSSA